MGNLNCTTNHECCAKDKARSLDHNRYKSLHVPNSRMVSTTKINRSKNVPTPTLSIRASLALKDTVRVLPSTLRTFCTPDLFGSGSTTKDVYATAASLADWKGTVSSQWQCATSFSAMLVLDESSPRTRPQEWWLGTSKACTLLARYGCLVAFRSSCARYYVVYHTGQGQWPQCCWYLLAGGDPDEGPNYTGHFHRVGPGIVSFIRERGSVHFHYLGMAQEFWDSAKYSLTLLKRLPNGNQRYRETHAA